MFYSTLKHKKQYEDQERLQAQKRAEIINFIISLIERANVQLNEQIKSLVVHVKVQIMNRMGVQHRGIERILGFFKDVQEAVQQAMQNIADETSSNATSTAKQSGGFHLPKIMPRNSRLRDQLESQQSIRSNNTKYSQNSRQQFPIKDYSHYEEQDEKKFLKDNGLGLKKKAMSKKKANSVQKQVVDPKIQEQLLKIKIKKQQQEMKKVKQKQQMEKKKELLKQKIHKQLQQRNIKQGLKGNEKDVITKVIFQENQISQNILEDDQINKVRNIYQEEDRDKESLGIVIKRYTPFIKKIFNRYVNLKGAKKDFNEAQNPQMNLVDLLRLCKQKNIEKNKNTIMDILKEVNNKNVNSLTIQVFFKFLQGLCIEVYLKQKCKTNVLMGDLMRKILRRMSEGENFKLDEDDDEGCNELSQKIKQNPRYELPQNYKKIYEKVYKINEQLSYPVRKCLKKDSYIDCFEIVHEMLQAIFDFNLIEEEVRILDQPRVVHKKQVFIPPKPIIKREKEQSVLPLLAEKETPDVTIPKKTTTRSSSRALKNQNKQSSKENLQSKSRSKILNQAEKKKIQEEQEQRKKKQIQEQLRKQRGIEVKRKLQKQQQEREKEKLLKMQNKKQQIQKQEQRVKKQKQKKQKYQKQQKQKIDKYKKQQQEKDKIDKTKQEQLKQKEQQQRKAKLKEQLKKEDDKRKQEYEKVKRQRQLSEQKNNKKKEDDQKKKDLLKKQMIKKMQSEKQKLQILKISKEIINKIYNQPQVQDIVNNKYKDEMKAIFNFGRQHNEFKLDKANANLIEQKGWISLCQQLNLCDSNTATKVFKLKSTQGFTQQNLQQTLFELATKKQIQSDLEDYGKAKKVCLQKFDQYLTLLKLPKGSQKLKEHFINLKNQSGNKKKQQMTVTNPNGEKQTWEIKE